jgi:hypothetical protein
MGNVTLFYNRGQNSPLDTVFGDFFFDVTALTGQVKTWLTSSFIAKPAKVWTGAAWVVKKAKRWDGAAWVETNY